MAKRRLYNAVEYMKDFFSSKTSTPEIGTLAGDDACILASMCVSANFWTKDSIGVSYWYYEVDRLENLQLAQLLLARNDVRTVAHMSSLNNGRVPMLRVRKSAMNDAGHNFASRVSYFKFQKKDLDAAWASIPTLRAKLTSDNNQQVR